MVWKTTHKYGLEIPNSVEDTIQTDKKNGNTIWQDALNKQMKSIDIAFKILEKDDLYLLGRRNRVVI